MSIWIQNFSLSALPIAEIFTFIFCRTKYAAYGISFRGFAIFHQCYVEMSIISMKNHFNIDAASVYETLQIKIWAQIFICQEKREIVKEKICLKSTQLPKQVIVKWWEWGVTQSINMCKSPSNYQPPNIFLSH